MNDETLLVDLGDATVELEIPLGVCAETERQTFDANFDDAAERVHDLGHAAHLQRAVALRVDDDVRAEALVR